jgi:hypothetical protein
VLYCWELQIEKAAKRRGLGRFLMQLLELLACRWVLTHARQDRVGLYPFGWCPLDGG